MFRVWRHEDAEVTAAAFITVPLLYPADGGQGTGCGGDEKLGICRLQIRSWGQSAVGRISRQPVHLFMSKMFYKRGAAACNRGNLLLLVGGLLY